MSIHIVTEFKTKDGRADDPNDIISAQRWTSREVYLSYRRWRAETGVTEKIGETLREPIVVRFFNDVQMKF